MSKRSSKTREFQDAYLHQYAMGRVKMVAAVALVEWFRQWNWQCRMVLRLYPPEI
jgi:hypothetical protein